MIFIAGTVACVWTGLAPVMSVSVIMQEGNYDLLVNRRPLAAQKLFEAAVEADSLAPEPCQSLANLLYSRWLESQKRNDHLFDEAIDWQLAAIERDPFAGKRYRRLGQMWMEKFHSSRDPSDAERGVEAFRKAVQLYPSWAALRADYALALLAAGQPAIEELKQASELDELNYQLHHFDKNIPLDLRRRIDRLIEEQTKSD